MVASLWIANQLIDTLYVTHLMIWFVIKLPDPSSQWHVNFIKVSNDTFWATILYIHYTHPPFITLIFTNHCICMT